MTQATWKNRRRMAWFSFLGIMLLLGAVFVRTIIFGDDPAPWTGIVSMIMGVLGAIVIGYTGFAAWDDVTKTKAKAKELLE